MERYNFGDRILIGTRLVRVTKKEKPTEIGRRPRTFKLWENKPLSKLTEVIVIGRRTLWNGERWMEEDMYLFNPKEKVSALLVAEKMSRKPYYVIPE